MWQCMIPWNGLLFEMAMLSQFLHIPLKFEIFHDRLGPGLRNTLFKDFWYRPKIWRDDAQYQETSYHVKLLCLGNLGALLNIAFH